MIGIARCFTVTLNNLPTLFHDHLSAQSHLNCVHCSFIWLAKQRIFSPVGTTELIHARSSTLYFPHVSTVSSEFRRECEKETERRGKAERGCVCVCWRVWPTVVCGRLHNTIRLQESEKEVLLFLTMWVRARERETAVQIHVTKGQSSNTKEWQHEAWGIAFLNINLLFSAALSLCLLFLRRLYW